jgi:glycerol-3-phosphate dehydrogenase
LSRRPEAAVGVIGAGVVGAAIAHSLARRRVPAIVFEAEREPGLAASGTNSGILHTGFDSAPGELETRLILRAAELRDRLGEGLGAPVIQCGAVLRPVGEAEAEVVAELSVNARRNGVEVELRDDGSLAVPGESVTDPVVYTRGLVDAAAAGGVVVRTEAAVVGLERAAAGLAVRTADGESVTCAVAVNCAGLRADEVARLAGDESFSVYPRKGEFFVFDPPEGEQLEQILLPVPSKRTKGVLVFPTVDGKVVAGPTAHDQDDKDDWAVREGAFAEVMPKASRMLPALEDAEPIASYAGLRPAGRGCNYVIGRSRTCERLINVAAIRSTGLSASLGIAEHVVELLAPQGIALGDDRELPPPAVRPASEPWWRRASGREAAV